MNHKKSELILEDFKEYFDKVQSAIGATIDLSNLLLIPFSRLMRYTLLLSTAMKKFKKDDDQESSEILRRALEHSRDISVYGDDIMLVGRVSGFPPGMMVHDIPKEGLLLLRTEVKCSKNKKDRE